MLQYWLWLATRKGLGARDAWLVAQHFSSPEAAYVADPREYERIEGISNYEPLLDKDLSLSNRILRQCYDRGISLMTIQDAAYPERLRVLNDPPLVLYVKGTLPDLNGPAIAVVGTRKASVYGLTQARRMGYGLARSGCAVISGGAKGIDTEAIKGALTGGGPAVVVLGCGVDVVYPKENRNLFQDVVGNGCLVSEFPPGTEPYSWHFPVRNRVISAMSLGVLVVEAPEKSGARITADRALEQGRDVFTLPANVGVESCSGNLKLLRDGAIPVGDAWDIIQEYQAIYPYLLTKQPGGDPAGGEIVPETKPSAVPETKKDIDKPKRKAYIDLKDDMDYLSSDERILVELLQDGPLHIDVITEQSQMNVGAALASLTLLEVKGFVHRPTARVYELAEK